MRTIGRLLPLLTLSIVAVPVSAAEPQLRITLSGHTEKILAVVFNPDGKMLASGSKDKIVKIWDLTAGKNSATLEGHTAEVTCLAFSPDGKTLASGSEDGAILLWDLASGKNTTRIVAHNNTVRSIAFTPDGKTLASGNWGDGIKLWDAASGANTATLKGFGCASWVAFSPDGKILASAHVGMHIALWDASAGKLSASCFDKKAELAIHSKVTFFPDGKTLICGHDQSDETLTIWDVATGKKIKGLKVGPVDAVAYAPESKTLISTSKSGRTELWNIDTGKSTATFQDRREYSSAAYSSDGKTLAVGTCDDEDERKLVIKVWGLEKLFGGDK